jgi:hypothetical protein
MLVSDLLSSIPSDTRRWVEESFAAHRKTVISALTKELRFPLSWGRSEATDTLLCSCAVSVDEIAIPERLAALKIPPEYALAAKLQIWLPSLTTFATSSKEMRQLIDGLRADLAQHIELPRFSEALQSSAATVEKLLQLSAIGKFDLTRHILSVNEDVLGVFQFHPREGEHGYKKSYRTDAKLYWGVLGLVSRALGVTLEGLTVKVLAHEYAHAYTHLSFDRNGQRWTGKRFAAADHVLKEGLAQYYAARCLDRMRDRVPEAWKAYEELLPKQPPAYRAHLIWLKQSTPEEVGAALARIRQEETATYKAFCEDLNIDPKDAEAEMNRTGEGEDGSTPCEA